MKGLIRGTLLIIVVLSAYSGVLYVQDCMRALVWIQSRDFCIDVRLSQSIRERIHSFIATHDIFNKLPCQEQESFLKQEFPCLDSCSFFFTASGHCNVELRAVNPMCVVNRTDVLAEKGLLLSIEHFDTAFLTQLPSIIVPQHCCTQQFDEACTQYIISMPWHLLRDYTCSWISSLESQLQHKNGHFVVLCSNEAIPDQVTMTSVEHIKKDLDEQGHIKKTSKEWVIDARFKDHMVVYACKKGG